MPAFCRSFHHAHSPLPAARRTLFTFEAVGCTAVAAGAKLDHRRRRCNDREQGASARRRSWLRLLGRRSCSARPSDRDTAGACVWATRPTARPHDTDGRAHKLELTREGVRLLGTALERLLKADEELLSRLSTGEQHMLIELLKKVARLEAARHRL